MEEDLHHDFEMLNTLAGMSEEEFYQFLDQLDEHQLEGFSQMIEQYMDKYGLDSEHDSPLPKLKAKKHFDAWVFCTQKSCDCREQKKWSQAFW